MTAGREQLRVRHLPGRRYELRLGKFLPVEVSEATYREKSVAELRTLVEEMTLFALVMVEKHDADLELRGSRFLEGARGQFRLVADDDAGEVPCPSRSRYSRRSTLPLMRAGTGC